MARTFSSGNYLALGSASALEITGDITIAAWVKISSSDVDNVLVGAYQTSGAYTGWGFGAGFNGGGKISYWSNNNGAWQSSTGTVGNNAWTHIAVRISGTGAGAGTFYRDGAADGTFTHSAPGASGQSKTIGATADGSNPFDGSAAEIAVYSAALSADEVAALAKGFSPLLIRPASLVAYWPLVGRMSPEPDRGKNNLAGTLTGSPAQAEHPRVYYPAGAQVFRAAAGGGGPSPVIYDVIGGGVIPFLR